MVCLLLITSSSLALDSLCTISWSEKFPISPYLERGGRQCIALQGDTVHIVWNPYSSAYLAPYRRSTDGGATFEPVLELAETTSGQRCEGGYIVASTSTVYAFYYLVEQGSSNALLCLRRSYDRGMSWSVPSRVYDYDIGVREIQNRDDTIIVLGFLSDGPVSGLSVLTSTNGGDSWIVGSMPPHGGEMHVAYANGYLHETHQYFVHSAEIYYSRSYDFGKTWAESRIISLPENGPIEPRIRTDPFGNPYIYWRDHSFDPPANVFLRRSTNQGGSWSEVFNLTPAGGAWDGFVAVSWRHIFAVWSASESIKRIGGSLLDYSTMDACPPAYLSPDPQPTSQGAANPVAAIGSRVAAVVWQEEDTSGEDAGYHLWARVGRLAHSDMTIDYQPGWALASLPLRPSRAYAMPNLYYYGYQYQRERAMIPGRGYWAIGSGPVEFEGSPAETDTIFVGRRWNLIGSISKPVPVDDVETIPVGILSSPFYEFYGSSYVIANTIVPGRAYWVKVSQNGKIILH
jgi:hypothetical protein